MVNYLKPNYSGLLVLGLPA